MAWRLRQTRDSEGSVNLATLVAWQREFANREQGSAFSGTLAWNPRIPVYFDFTQLFIRIVDF